jgi:hydrogenase expression/formation protein HypC
MRMAKVQFGGISKQICLEYVPEAQIGDYVPVHVGFALARIDEEEAKRVIELLQTIGGVDELDDSPPRPPLWRRVEPICAS